MLIALAGLPGTGKSHVATIVARAMGAVVVSVDPIEAAMWRAGVGAPGRRDVPTGLAAYLVAEAVAERALEDGLTVVVDAVNAVEPARAQWRGLATRADVPLAFVDVVCSDPATHRARLERRRRHIPGFPDDAEPSWAEASAREVDPWVDDRLLIDTAPSAALSDDDVARRVRAYVAARGARGPRAAG